VDIDFVLWDHDGIFVDTERWFFEATRSTLRDFDIELSQHHWLDCQAQGLGLRKVVSASRGDQVDLTQIRRLRDDLYEELLENNDVLIDGGTDVLALLGKRLRMALVTMSPRRFVDQLHGGTSFLSHFEHVVTGEDCSQGKPHPEPYLRAMAMLGATPRRSVAVEDSMRGLTSAISAGLRCFVVRSEFMATYDFEGACAVLDDIRELPSHLAI
jgi:HAD superfamily hydrolase (TIGR01509 family)